MSICLRCDSEEFKVLPDAPIEQEYKGMTFTVNTDAIACVKCGWVTLALDQVDALCSKTKHEHARRLQEVCGQQ
jgi:hypothetical protein